MSKFESLQKVESRAQSADPRNLKENLKLLTLEALKNFPTYNECSHFLSFICNTVYESFLSNNFECCIETSQSIMLACFCKVKNSQVKK